MSFLLKNLITIPPGGWHYIQPETGLKIEGGNYIELRERVRQHRDNNRFENGPQIDVEIQSQMCLRLSEHDQKEWCRDPEEALKAPRSISIGDARNFLKVLGDWLRTGFKFVEQPEAERRAAICVQCSENVQIAGCAGCQNVGPLITATIGHRHTPFDERLAGCHVCGCSNKAQIWVPLATLQKGITPDMEFPTWCWKRIVPED